RNWPKIFLHPFLPINESLKIFLRIQRDFFFPNEPIPKMRQTRGRCNSSLLDRILNFYSKGSSKVPTALQESSPCFFGRHTATAEKKTAGPDAQADATPGLENKAAPANRPLAYPTDAFSS